MHPLHDQARKGHGDKLSELTGERGEYPPDRAARIVGTAPAGAQGDSAQPPKEEFIGAPARQVSNTGSVRK